MLRLTGQVEDQIDTHNRQIGIVDLETTWRLLEVQEKRSGLQSMLRLDLARQSVAASCVQRAKEAVYLLGPVVTALRKTEHLIEVANLRGHAYLLLNRPLSATVWFDVAADPAGHQDQLEAAAQLQALL